MISSPFALASDTAITAVKALLISLFFVLTALLASSITEAISSTFCRISLSGIPALVAASFTVLLTTSSAILPFASATSLIVLVSIAFRTSSVVLFASDASFATIATASLNFTKAKSFLSSTPSTSFSFASTGSKFFTFSYASLSPLISAAVASGFATASSPLALSPIRITLSLTENSPSPSLSTNASFGTIYSASVKFRSLGISNTIDPFASTLVDLYCFFPTISVAGVTNFTT